MRIVLFSVVLSIAGKEITSICYRTNKEYLFKKKV